MGWTDSVRFRWDGTNNNVTAADPLTIPTDDDDKNADESTVAANDLRLGRCPRDMRFPRSLLVDGWVLTCVPQSANHKASAKFLRWFLDVDQQQALLKRGFPSPSPEVVRRETVAQANRKLASSSLRTKNEVAENCYEVFLETLSTALNNGSWVPAHEQAPKVGEVVQKALLTLIA